MSRSIVDTEVIAAAAGDINRLAESIQADVATLRGRLGWARGSRRQRAKRARRQRAKRARVAFSCSR